MPEQSGGGRKAKNAKLKEGGLSTKPWVGEQFLGKREGGILLFLQGGIEGGVVENARRDGRPQRVS